MRNPGALSPLLSADDLAPRVGSRRRGSQDSNLPLSPMLGFLGRVQGSSSDTQNDPAICTLGRSWGDAAPHLPTSQIRTRFLVVGLPHAEAGLCRREAFKFQLLL